jgi:hypothetical protein
MLRDYQLRGGQLKAIEQRAGQTNQELRRAVSQIGLLGPQEVREAAGAVRFSFAWEGRWAIELLAEYGVDEDHPQVGDIEVDPSRLGLTREQVDRWQMRCPGHWNSSS